MPHSKPPLAVGAIAVVFAAILRLPAMDPTETPPPRPKLAVVVVFDQFRAGYLQEWEHLFGPGGFKRLRSDGATFVNCHYPYCYTLTAPGHTSIATGATPSRHGIIANDWYDRESAETVSSVTPPPTKRSTGPGPYRRRSPTIGDMLLEALGTRGRVASLSIKDRAAILMAALRAQICYWFDERNGQFVTSPYYRDEAHPWVKSFNASGPADRWTNRDWTRLRGDIDYAAHSGPDEFFAEGIGYGQGRTFPHPTPFDGKAKGSYYAAVCNSPFGNDLLLEFAKTAIVAEKLGQTDSTDLLCLSFSSNDLVGHCWGPDSQEVLDMTLRSDRVVADLLAFLDEKVGKGNYVFAISSDHGVCPLPEFAAKRGKDAGRAPPEILTSLAETHLNREFLPEGQRLAWFETPKKYNPWVYFNRPALKEMNLDQSKVERSLADWMKTQTGILDAFTRTELMSPADADPNPIRDAVRKSFRPEASGDVMVVLKPYHLFSPPLLSKDPSKNDAYRTSHGTPHPYDTHVPLIVMGPRIAPGVRETRVAPQSLAAIVSEALGISAPNDAEYPVPAGLFKK